jgi:tetratricopeptide (TPR) repeat protein
MRIRHFHRSLAALAVCGLFVAEVGAQQITVQSLIERGALDEAVQRAEGERDNVESTYLAAQAFTKMDQPGRAAEEYARLRDAGDDSWKAIGESGALLSEGNMDGAMAAAERAVQVNGENPYAHYQVATVASRQGNFNRAAEEFTRAAQLKPDLAYAHYYAGLAYQRVKNVPKMSEHFEAFMRLAPDAPERAAGATRLRPLRPRRN